MALLLDGRGGETASECLNSSTPSHSVSVQEDNKDRYTKVAPEPNHLDLKLISVAHYQCGLGQIFNLTITQFSHFYKLGNNIN